MKALVESTLHAQECWLRSESIELLCLRYILLPLIFLQEKTTTKYLFLWNNDEVYKNCSNVSVILISENSWFWRIFFPTKDV